MRTWQQITSGSLRHINTLIGGFMAHAGLVANDHTILASGTIVAVISLGQSWLSKLKSDVQRIDAARASFLEAREIQSVPGVSTANPPMGPKSGNSGAALLLCFLLSALCFSGCKSSPVPATEFGGTIGGQPFSFTGRKQTEVKDLELTLNAGSGTNTTNFHLKIGVLSSKNDERVISKSYAGQAAVEKVRWEGMNSFASKFAEGAGKAVNPLP